VCVFLKEMPILFQGKFIRESIYIKVIRMGICQKPHSEPIAHLKEFIHNISMFHQQQLCIQEHTKRKMFLYYNILLLRTA